MKTILLGTMTYKGKDYILDRWMKRINKLIIPDNTLVDFLVIDNTDDDGEYASFINKNYNIKVLRSKRYDDTRTTIATARNMLRDKVIECNYDYLFMLEIDVIPPIDILTELINHDVPVVSGYYYVGQGLHFKRPCVVLPFKEMEGVKTFDEAVKYKSENKIIENAVELALTKNKLVKVFEGSMGNCLIKKEVLEKIKFIHMKGSEITHDDTFFYADCDMNNIPVYVDSDMLCSHFQSTWYKELVLQRVDEREWHASQIKNIGEQ